MMQLRNHIKTDFSVVNPYRGVNSIRDELILKGYVVVIDEEKKFWGVLTPADLIKRPHILVADCLTQKDVLTEQDTIDQAFAKFYTNQSKALPYFHSQEFVGIVEKELLTKSMLTSIDDLFEKSAAADKLKKLILANISHEVRTPLNSIVGFMELISEITPEDALYSEFSGIIRKSAEHFLIIMNDLVDLSLIRAGHTFNLSIVPCHLNEIFREIESLFCNHFLYSNKVEVELCFTNLNNEVIVHTDEKRLKHILYHLVDSVIRSLDKGKIEYGYSLPQDGKVQISLDMYIETKADKKLMFLAIPGNNENPKDEISFVWIQKLVELLNGDISHVEVSSNHHCFRFVLPVEYSVYAN